MPRFRKCVDRTNLDARHTHARTMNDNFLMKYIPPINTDICLGECLMFICLEVFFRFAVYSSIVTVMFRVANVLWSDLVHFIVTVNRKE